MRWLVAWLVAVASTASVARAKIVIMEPAIVRQCSHAPSWQRIEKCLRKLGKPVVVRTLSGAKLVRLDQRNGDGSTFDAGLSLYVPRGKQWQLAGLYEPRGEYELLDASTLTVAKHSGFRVDVGEVLRTSVSPDGVQSVPAVLTTHRVLFCGAETWRCTEVVSTCDVLVRGGALWSFHGTISIGDNQIKVAGDRRNVGSFCDAPETEYLGWTQP
ncbi:MAG: hypothetical protein ACM31C_22520 [Acidobacteriota bacterium]